MGTTSTSSTSLQPSSPLASTPLRCPPPSSGPWPPNPPSSAPASASSPAYRPRAPRPLHRRPAPPHDACRRRYGTHARMRAAGAWPPAPACAVPDRRRFGLRARTSVGRRCTQADPQPPRVVRSWLDAPASMKRRRPQPCHRPLTDRPPPASRRPKPRHRPLTTPQGADRPARRHLGSSARESPPAAAPPPVLLLARSPHRHSTSPDRRTGPPPRRPSTPAAARSGLPAPLSCCHPRLSYKARVVGRLVAWKGPKEPSAGDFSVSLDPSSNLQVVIWNGTRPYCRIRVFGGVSVFRGAYQRNTGSISYDTVSTVRDEFYSMYTVSAGSPCIFIKLDYTGMLRGLSWNNQSSSWTVIYERPAAGSCELYASCGPFGYCDFTGAVPMCQCLDGFEPDFPRGCRRTEALKCGKGNHFVALAGMKVPDKFLHVKNRSFDQCAAECSRNCYKKIRAKLADTVKNN